MFGRWIGRAARIEELRDIEKFEQTVRDALGSSDEESVLVIAAIVGLLGAVAYADGEFSPQEQQHVRTELARIDGMNTSGVDAVCAALKRHVREIKAVETPRYSRILRDLADRELRVQVLDMLLALAAADESVTTAETNFIRQTATALGLTQSDYNALQDKYKEYLSVLR
jgi:uncharacterized tellurite resistance protein B-like protein